MLTYVEASLFTSPARVLVNTVNTVGVMGKGVAKEFKTRYPSMFDAYRESCKRGELAVGRLLLFRTPDRWILNFPTKRHWRSPSRLDDIERGLQTFVRTYANLGIASIAFPRLGCGNGQLDWELQVRPLMERYLADLAINIFVHLDAADATEDELTRSSEPSIQARPAAPRFEQVWNDLVALVGEQGSDEWSIVDSDRGLAGLCHRSGWIMTEAELFDLWHQARTFGYVTVEDVSSAPSDGADALVNLLERLVYLQLARFVILDNKGNMDRTMTVPQLIDAAPRGLRYAPVADQPTPAAQTADRNTGAELWSESRTTKRLQLSLTN